MNEEWVYSDFKDDSEVRNADWCIGMVVRQIYHTADADPYGRDSYGNGLTYAKKMREYVKSHSGEINLNRVEFMEVYFSLCRDQEKLRIALCDCIGLNCLFEVPLSTEEFISTVDRAEKRYSQKKGFFWNPESIAKKVGIPMEELGIGTRLIRRQKSRRFHNNSDRREERIRELFLNEGMAPDNIAEVLIGEGLKASPRTVYRIISDLGLREEKERLLHT